MKCGKGRGLAEACRPRLLLAFLLRGLVGTAVVPLFIQRDHCHNSVIYWIGLWPRKKPISLWIQGSVSSFALSSATSITNQIALRQVCKGLTEGRGWGTSPEGELGSKLHCATINLISPISLNKQHLHISQKQLQVPDFSYILFS